MTPMVFIGSGEASLLERKTLIHSIEQNSSGPVDIRVFNGTHNAIERPGQPPVPAELPLHIKYQNITEFSLYRYLIPALCGHRGRAIWLDSDTICLGDIYELFNLELGGAELACKPDYAPDQWGPSVALFDCERLRFDLELIFNEIASGRYTYTQFTRFAPEYRAQHPIRITTLPETWNSFDYYDDATRLIHYTELDTQPWAFHDHPYGDIWFEWFQRARAAGAVTEEDIDKTIRRHYCRRDVRSGNWSGPTARVRALLHDAKRHFVEGKPGVVPFRVRALARTLAGRVGA
jgi:lipopolysaccharide biosynthesis glycosyltransferase